MSDVEVLNWLEANADELVPFMAEPERDADMRWRLTFNDGDIAWGKTIKAAVETARRAKGFLRDNEAAR